MAETVMLSRSGIKFRGNLYFHTDLFLEATLYQTFEVVEPLSRFPREICVRRGDQLLWIQAWKIGSRYIDERIPALYSLVRSHFESDKEKRRGKAHLPPLSRQRTISSLQSPFRKASSDCCTSGSNKRLHQQNIRTTFLGKPSSAQPSLASCNGAETVNEKGEISMITIRRTEDGTGLTSRQVV